MPSQIKLLTSDECTVTVDKDVAECSVIIKNMLEDLGEVDEAIPIANVSEEVLMKVIEWCKHHKNDGPLPEDDEKKFREGTVDVGEWDKKFMDVEQGMLFAIIMAANFLDIKGLLDLGCKTVANMIRGKSTEEMREILQIENDFTPEEEEEIRRQNEWAEDR